MNPVIILLIAILFAVFFLGGGLLVSSTLYKRVAADELLVRTGMGGMQFSQGQGEIVLPFIHEYSYLSLAPLILKINLTGSLRVEDMAKDEPATFIVAIPVDTETAEDMWYDAATRLAGMSRNAIRDLATETIVAEIHRLQHDSGRPLTYHDLQNDLIGYVAPKLAEFGLTLQSHVTPPKGG
jgi:uncharacterized membrane protein YqiK